jgi:hypothetical protein
MTLMSTATEEIRKLLLAQFKGDDEAVCAAARELVERERSLNHHVLVSELERILANSNGQPERKKEVLSTLAGMSGNLPRDKERNAALIELRNPAESWGTSCSPRPCDKHSNESSSNVARRSSLGHTGFVPSPRCSSLLS